MWRDRLMRREDPRDAAFEIADSAGTVLTVVLLVEVLELCGERRIPSIHWPAAHAQIERAHQLRSELAAIRDKTCQAVSDSRKILTRAARS